MVFWICLLYTSISRIIIERTLKLVTITICTARPGIVIGKGGQDVDAHRQIIFDAIVQYRHMKNLGVVAVFDRLKFDKYAHFARIGEGSLGGKGRGLAFLEMCIRDSSCTVC